ncbi:hypothetical protein BJV85_000714 [Clostridium acetobutylicum]|uniref:DUF1573 domain-containing protein n=1 Tax=Clostridium acetobutylicum (strain ATCC 824 / DSM 792 / JCM 1419 / IAM 19013 / LMG 5710 / NBRC 13948 / NRRL B-527 / VKM B-1787 / 2291 / W) TaxID=272562 RepID=Q97EC7_CLOAB|nr:MULTISPECIES: hypothetical protein [Clostridium]AAK81123.1 Hypothetical protein CA_C3186 [Clostridium acetobutylicum ATCC 824]ADZ22227.1 Conserved hypothetical protein [Clostridium acetobutylicum EA 2018]AEI32702.1 hypothetical protein SMB_G3222 [Clostridium acetobutylicum DSM 1731]AWV82099.1 DUF1573 domain-containing protein [Clostridium acetobutylicum]AWV82148.1 DUF1573 domain-containing protein [Clostridium acetobutylicum]
MQDLIFDEFQNLVDESLIRHSSLLDILSKLQESQGRINRAVTKSVTRCGCIEINASKQQIPNDLSDINALKKCLKTHVSGKLCEGCRDILINEIGNNLFYLSALCNTLDINLYDVLLREYDKIDTLGKYNLR